MKNSQLITALDIGTTKICTIIAEVTENYKLEILGIGLSEAKGLEKGIVKDIYKASEAIKLSIAAAEEKAQVEAENIYAGIAGDHIKSQTTQGKITLSTENKHNPVDINQEHVEQVITDAKSNVKLQPGNQTLEIIHGIPQYYLIDDQPEDILNPIAMSGHQLTACVHVILANVSAIRNLKKCIQIAGYEVKSIVLEPIASALAVLNEDELNLGCIMIDMGGGTTDVAVCYKNSVRYTCIEPIGGTNITQDIAIGLRTPIKFAEDIKVSKGNVLSSQIDESETIAIEGIGGRLQNQKKLRLVAEIIESRVKETLEMAYQDVIEHYLKRELITAGVILTGGSALLKNIDLLAQEIFNLPVKIGFPIMDKLATPNQDLSSPKFATSLGLLYYGLEEIPKKSYFESGSRSAKNKASFSGSFGKSFRKLIKNLSEYI